VAVGLVLATAAQAHDWPQPGYLPLNTLVELKAPPTPVNKDSAPKRFTTFHYSEHAPYQSVYRFKVEKGQRYTFIDCNPAVSGKEVWISLVGSSPVTDYSYALGGPNGTMTAFISHFQQPWPIEKDETATCDAYRHNFSIAPQSENGDLYVVVGFNKPDGRAKVMLKTPADNDHDVEKSTDSPSRPKHKGFTWGTVWSQPLMLRNIPGELVAVQPPIATPAKSHDPDANPQDRERPIEPPVAVPLLETDAVSYAPGAGITLRYSGITHPAGQDWVGLFKDDAGNDQYGDWQSLGGYASGLLRFKAPTSVGNYEFRMFLDWPSGGYKDVARSRRIVVQVVEPPRVEETWLDAIRSGRPFQVVFDVAPSKFNDQGWLGEGKDPMGTLKGGETYSVVYRPPGWTVTGFNEGTNGLGTWAHEGMQPEAHLLNLWGRGYAFSRNGEVFDFDYGLVGHLRR
jgi:hypothetical protein